MSSPRPKLTEKVRRVALTGTLVAGGLVFALVVNEHYQLADWLFFRYARLWLLSLAFAAACLSAGHALLTRGFRLFLPIQEQLFLDFCAGLLVFALSLFGCGLAGMLNRVTSWVLPLSLATLGAPALVGYAERVWRRSCRPSPARPSAFGPRVWGPAISGFGALCVLLLYVNILTPAHASYDARWYHFALAEHYAAAGAIERFPEGFYGATFPHLASYVYTWAFLVNQALPTQMLLAAHLEFVVFGATLFGLPVLVRYLLHGRRAPRSWASLFLFPGILLYDSSLAGNSDHFLALFALAALLVLRRVLGDFELRTTALFALFCAAAALTKYHAVDVLAGLVLLFVAGACRHVLSQRERSDLRVIVARVARAGLLALGVFALVWAPHWLKNWVYYGDPFYPVLRDWLPPRPWTPGAAVGFAPPEWRPSSAFPGSLLEALGTVVTFSFAPHDWPNLHGRVPVFGSLFTLFVPALLFLPRSGRAWLVAGSALAGVFTWYLTLHQDRYLQALLPWMAAVVAAVIVKAWEHGRAVRAAIAGVVGLQVVWGGDVYFLPTHAMLWKAPLVASAELLASGFKQDLALRDATLCELELLRPALSRKRDVLLVHESHLRLGSGVRTVMDARGAQAAIDYAGLASPRAVWERLRSLGVTKLTWKPGASGPEARLSDELVFLAFVAHVSEAQPFGPLLLARLPETPPPARAVQVAVAGCDRSGSVELEAVDALSSGPLQFAPLVDEADVWLVERGCPGGSRALPRGFRAAGAFGRFEIKTR